MIRVVMFNEGKIITLFKMYFRITLGKKSWNKPSMCPETVSNETVNCV